MIIESDVARGFHRMVAGAKNIVIVGHLNPDGDCIGSLTGMNAFLRSCLGREAGVSMIVPGVFPYYLEFMDSTSDIVVFSKEPDRGKKLVGAADLIVFMDLNALSRTEDMAEILSQSAARKIMIDHHPSPEGFADLTISQTEVSSACELAWWLVSEVAAQTGKEIPRAAMESFYTGMMTDTNNFCNSVFPSTFLMASRIAEAGIDIERIQMEIMNCYSEQRMRLMGEMLLNNMAMFPKYGAACMVIDKSAKDRFCYRDGDSEGFVNLPLKIKEVEISALFTQADGFIRVSLRSKGAVSVNQLSRSFFNGGGHERAAGGRLYMPIDEVKGYFEKALESFLGE